MKRIRCFAAIELPLGLLKKLRRPRNEISGLAGKLKLVEEENQHLTVKFIGEVSDKDVVRICGICREEAARIPPLHLLVRDIGVFPHSKRPRVFWAGVEDLEGDGLDRLHRALDSRLAPLGVKEERRRYHPHLTLARVKALENPGAVTALLGRWDREFGDVWAGEITLLMSELGHGGPRYTPLGRFPLVGPEEG